MSDHDVTMHYNYGGATKAVTPDEVTWHEQNGWTRADRIAAWNTHPRTRRRTGHTEPINTIPAPDA